MSDPMATFWSLVETDTALVTPDLLNQWSPSLQSALLGWHWLRPATDAAFVLCPDCGDHWEEPILGNGPDGRDRLFIPCPIHVRVEVDASLLQQWSVDIDALAVSVAETLALSGRTTTVIPGRLWRLGKTRWQDSSRDVWLARGLAGVDCQAVAAALRPSVRPIVLVPDWMPDEQLWSGKLPAVVRLSHVSHLRDGKFTFDHKHLIALVIQQDEDSEESQSAAESPENYELMIRRQIKAEIASMLTDDVLVAAYKEHGSCRKAAEALSEQTQQPISKDRINRAVKRAGGLTSVAANSSSHSVRRTVASQRCDGQKKIPNVAEAMDWQ